MTPSLIKASISLPAETQRYRLQNQRDNLFHECSWSPAMTVNIDGVEPNIFPDVDDLDARDAGRNVEVFLDVRVDANQPRSPLS